ncbi:MAG TPA: response regulator transcription factor [Chthonomonadaceae bacterium]|nr:response regulator transcription factor [Chthonomonadaceae bacterium]
MATILIVDDHPTNRQMLATLLGYQRHRVLEAADGFEALALVHEHHPDLMITDLLMPEMDGFELVQQMRADVATACTRVIFYTANYPENEALALARACGIRHLLPKPSEPEMILHTLDVALREPFAPGAISSEDFAREHRRLLTNTLLHKVNALERESANPKRAEPTSVADASPEGSAFGSLKPLTRRQREILQLIAEGCTTQEIAYKLFVSVKTVETHRAHLMDRLNIHNVAGLVRYAIRLGLLPADS